MENLPPKLCDLEENQEIRVELGNESDIEGQIEILSNRQDNFRHVVSESCIFATALVNDYIEIAQDEEKTSRSVLLDKIFEMFAFSHLLSTGQFGYTTERETKLSHVNHFNQRLHHYIVIVCGL